MGLLDRSYFIQNICGIEIDASATILPSADGSIQPFDNTFVSESEAESVYFGKASASLQQVGKNTRAGMLYDQKLTIKFPQGDVLTEKRLREYIKVKYIYIKLSGGKQLFFGRNDYFQNAPIKVGIKNNEKICEIEYTSRSIFPIGQTNGSADFFLGESLPINFFNP